jgi:hypothetical protein
MRRAGSTLVAIIAAATLGACGGSTTNTTHTSSASTRTAAASSTQASSATSATSTTAAAVPIAQDKNPSQPDYWAPTYENGLVSSCVGNKIAPTENMCNCILALLQSHHPALAEQAGSRETVDQWMRTASGNPFGLRGYALRCGQG